MNVAAESVKTDREHDRRMSALAEDGIQLTIELRGLPKATKKSAGKGTPFMPLEGRIVGNGPDHGQRKDITLWGDVAETFLSATRYLRPTGETPLTVTFRGRNRLIQSYNAGSDMRNQKWPFNAKAFDIDWTSPAATRPFPAPAQRMQVLGVEEREIGASKQKVPMVLAKPIDGEQRKVRFKMPITGEWRQQYAALSAATPLKPIDAVFQGEWRMIDHNGGKAPSFKAAACLEIEGLKRTQAPKSRNDLQVA